MQKLFCSRDLNLELKIRLMRCYVLSVLYYGMEAWIQKITDMERLEAFEMWMYRKILGIAWVVTVKLLYMGHVMKREKYRMLKIIIQGEIQGKRSVLSRRNSWLKNLRKWLGCNNNKLLGTSVSKIKIAQMITSL